MRNASSPGASPTEAEPGQTRRTTSTRDGSILWQRWPHLPAAALYAVLTGVVLWPAVVRFRSRPMIDLIDGAMFEWAWWAMPRAVGEGRNPFRTDEILHPVGADLALTTTAPLVNALTWPVQATLGTAAQINLVQLVSMFLAGFVTYLLAHRVCGHRGAAFVAGVAYALLPQRFVRVHSHLNLIETFVLPLGVLAYLRFVERPTWGRAVALGAVGGGAFLIEAQLAILLVACLVPLAVLHRRDLAQGGRQLALGGVTALVVAAPLLVPMLLALLRGGAAAPQSTASALRYSASPFSWVVPPTEWLLLGRVVSIEPLTQTGEGLAYPGLLMLGLCVAGASLVGKAPRRGWVAMVVVGFVLSLGPYIYVRDSYVEVPLPFFVLRAVPGLDLLRAPGRFALVGALGIVVLAAQVLSVLAERAPRRAALLVVGAVAITVVELAPGSLPERPAEVPEAYRDLAADPGDGAVLEVPLKWSTTQGQFGFEGGQRQDFMFMVYATVHGKPIVSGAVSRYPDDDLDRLLAIPLYRQLLAAGEQPGFDEPLTFTVEDLRALEIGYVVHHRDEPAVDEVRHLESLDLPVLADDGRVVIWRVPPRA